jgi:hypothetical protein
MMNETESMMVDEAKVLEVVKGATDVPAYFFNGTLFLKTGNSVVATRVFTELCKKVAPVSSMALSFGKVGEAETFYDFR